MDTVSISDKGAGSDSGAAAMSARASGTGPARAAQEPALRGQLDEDRLAWLALALTPGLGPKRILDAVRQLGSPSQIFTLPLTALEGLRFPAEAAQFLFDGKGRRAAEEEWARVASGRYRERRTGGARFRGRLDQQLNGSGSLASLGHGLVLEASLARKGPRLAGAPVEWPYLWQKSK